MVDDFVRVYPNLETISLENDLTMAYHTDDTFWIDEESASMVYVSNVLLQSFYQGLISTYPP